MPGFDGTGPMGYGPLTGRQMGYCVGYPYPYGRMRRRRSYRGMGMGMGMGMGRRPGRFAYAPTWYYPGTEYMPEPTLAEERVYLQEQAQYLEEELKEIKARLADLEEEK